MHNVIPLVGRILLALIFAQSGMNKLGDGFESTQQYMAAYGMEATALWLTIGIFLELAGSLLVILGIFERVGAVGLLAFLVPVTFIFHTDFSDRTQMIMFMKNLSMIGGLILLAYFGGGNWGLGRLMKRV